MCLTTGTGFKNFADIAKPPSGTKTSKEVRCLRIKGSGKAISNPLPAKVFLLAKGLERAISKVPKGHFFHHIFLMQKMMATIFFTREALGKMEAKGRQAKEVTQVTQVPKVTQVR